MDSIRSKDASKVMAVLNEGWPFETAAVSFTIIAGSYAKLYAPWRHRHWPYSAEQVSLRERFLIQLKPPYAPKRIFLPVLIGGWVLDKIRRAILRNK